MWNFFANNSLHRRRELGWHLMGPGQLTFQRLEDRRLLATFTVTNNMDGPVSSSGDLPGSLRQAIFDANATTADDTIVFESSVFTGGNASLIRLTAGELEITKTLTIDGAAGTDVTITGDANGDDITDENDITDMLASLGSVGGDLLDDNSRVVNFSANSGDLTLNSLAITGGRVTNSFEGGGGIQFSSSNSISLIRSIVSGNSIAGSAAKGGGIHSEGSLSLTGSTVSGNLTSGNFSDGGGISVGLASASLTNSTVSNNRTMGTSSNGGGIYIGVGSLVLADSTISGNTTDGEGATGGGIYSFSGDVSLTDSTVSGNFTTGYSVDGGGIYTLEGDVSLVSSTVSNNFTSNVSNGGGIFAGEGDVTLTTSTVSGNAADDTGGGVFSGRGAVTLSNSTVSGNSAGVLGGGIFVLDNPVGGNQPFTSINSIIAGNTAGVGTPSDLVPDPDSTLLINQSLIGVTDGLTITGAGNLTGTAANPLDPKLGPLADNGGPTQTHALLDGSPALDAVSLPPLAGDYRLNGPLPFGLGAEGGSLTGDGYLFGIDEGLTLAAPAITSPDYAIELRFSFDTLSGFQKILDFEDMGSDSGLYTEGNVLNFFVAGVTQHKSTAVLSVNTLHQLVLSRDTSNEVKIYLDGTEVVSFNDSTGAANIGSILRFFQDDTIDGSGAEAGAGFVEFIRLYDTDLSATQVAALPSIDSEQRGQTRIAGGGVDMGAFERQFVESTTLVVSTNSDVVDGNYLPGELSLREAITVANSSPGKDKITFDAGTFNGGANSLIRLTNGELAVTETLTIDGSTGSNVTITGDANDDDITDAMNITDVADSTALDDRLDDNSRVLSFATASGDLTLNDLTITGGRTTSQSAKGGGLLFGSSGTLTLSESTVSGNSTAGDFAQGGGISHSGSFTFTNSTVSGNSTSGYKARGGGIYTYSGSVSAANSTVSGNRTTGRQADGAGVSTVFGTVTMTDSTVSGNRTSGGFTHGGGIFGGSVILTNSTVTANTAASGNGGGIYQSIYLFGSFITIENSIIAGNANGGNANDIVLSPDRTLTINHSLIGVTDNITQTITGNLGNKTGTTASPLDPLLGPLAFNGGPTKTHALLQGSPAIDAGNSTGQVDQRGTTRAVDLAGVSNAGTSNGADIGAFERQIIEPIASPPVVTTFARDDGAGMTRPDLLASVSVTFNVDVAITYDDLTIRNDTLGGQEINSNGLIFNYDSPTKTATWNFANLTLDPAFYFFELSSDIVSVASNLSLDGDSDGNPGGAYVGSVYVALPGDANLDGRVDVLGDAFALVGGLGTTGGATWAQGDFSGDGMVNVLGDAFILVGNLGKTVVPPAPAVAFSIDLARSSPKVVAEPAQPVLELVSATSFVQQEDDRKHMTFALAKANLQLAGAEDFDAAFGAGDLIDDGLF